MQLRFLCVDRNEVLNEVKFSRTGTWTLENTMCYFIQFMLQEDKDSFLSLS